jgi:hypothetical protein
MACRPNDIEQFSGGEVLRCLDERATPPPRTLAQQPPSVPAAAAADSRAGLPLDAGDSSAWGPVGLQCTSFNYSGWSNNAAMFTKSWWLTVLTSAASLTDDGSGMFEVRKSRSRRRQA